MQMIAYSFLKSRWIAAGRFAAETIRREDVTTQLFRRR